MHFRKHDFQLSSRNNTVLFLWYTYDDNFSLWKLIRVHVWSKTKVDVILRKYSSSSWLWNGVILPEFVHMFITGWHSYKCTVASKYYHQHLTRGYMLYMFWCIKYYYNGHSLYASVYFRGNRNFIISAIKVDFMSWKTRRRTALYSS